MSDGHFVFQRVHVRNGKALHLSAHLDITARAFEHIYGFRPDFDEKTVAEVLKREHLRRANRLSTQTDSVATICFAPKEGGGCDVAWRDDRMLLEPGYAHSPLRPKAATYDYSIPFGGLSTSFQLAARALYDTLALASYGATRSVRREGELLLSCGENPLFAIRGRTVFTTPLADGAADGVERRLVLAAAEKARLRVVEEPLLLSKLRDYDELFFADAAGITSLAECDGAKFMSLSAARIAAEMGSVVL
jgi:hypothetical protein